MADILGNERAFLRFFLNGRAHARVWINAERRFLGPVEDIASPPLGAYGVAVRRIEDANGLSFRGAAVDRASISLAGLARLAPFWAEPLHTLNAAGEAKAREPAPAPRVKRSFDLPPALDKRLEAAAAAAGRKVSPYLSDLVAKHLGHVE